MQTPNPYAAKSLVGGRLCLDFVNTIGQHAPEPLDEWLHAYDDLVWWSLKAEPLDEAVGQALFAAARAQPDEAARVFARAVALREALFRIFAAAAEGRQVPGDDLRVLNEELALAMPHLRMVPGAGCCGWEWSGDDALDRVLWPVARSAATLLTEPDNLARIGTCEGERCQWMYIDTSRNRSRRWCVMADCGNRAKARRHYHRAKSAAEGD